MKRITRKTIVMLCLSLLLLLSAACGQAPEEQTNDTNLQTEQQEQQESAASGRAISQEELESVLAKQGLDWQVADSHVEGDSSAYAFYLEDYNRLIGVQTQAAASGGVVLISSQVLNSEEVAKQPEAELLPQLYALAQALYPQSEKADKIFAELEESLTGGDWSYAYNPSATQREGELCYCLNMSYSEGAYSLGNLRILSADAYEALQQKALATVKEGYEDLTEISIAEAKEQKKDEDNSYFQVTAHVESAKDAGEEFPLGWQKVELSDGKDSIEALLQPHCFTEDELAMDREHILCFQSELPLPILLCSALSK